jgi:hypothetical protein
MSEAELKERIKLSYFDKQSLPRRARSLQAKYRFSRKWTKSYDTKNYLIIF